MIVWMIIFMILVVDSFSDSGIHTFHSAIIIIIIIIMLKRLKLTNMIIKQIIN